MSDDARDPLALRHERFRGSLGQRRQLIIERWTELRLVRWSRAGIDQLRGWVRELAEHSTEFGYPAMGDMARELEHRLSGMIADYPPFKELLGGATASLERLNLQVDRVLIMGPTELPVPPTEEQIAAARPPRVLIGDADEAALALVETVALGLRMEARIAGESGALREMLALDKPDAVIVDEAFLAQMGDPLTPGAATTGPRFGKAAWILLSDRQDIDLRLRALRAGASSCLGKPVDVQELEFALQIACLPALKYSLNVWVIADTPALAEQHAEALREAGMNPLLGAGPDQLPDVVAAHTADVLLININLDPHLRDLWLGLLADTPGCEGLPVVCLTAQRTPPLTRHRRTSFVASPVPAKELTQSLRRAVLENDRDIARVAHLVRERAHRNVCLHEVFMARLAEAIAARGSDSARPALVAADLDAALPLLRDHGTAALLRAQRRIEDKLLDALGEHGHCTRLGSSGMLALLPATDADGKHALLARLAQALNQPDGDAVAGTASAVLLPLNAAITSPLDALHRLDAALRAARSGGGHRYLLLETAAAKEAAASLATAATVASALPVDQLLIEVKPLKDAAGSPQPLHDASIRMRDLDGKPQSLSSLLSDIVAKDLATQLDLWEMHAAAGYLQALPDTTRGIEISMRLSTASRESSMLVPVVKSIVATLPPNRGFRLVFEVAESWLVERGSGGVEMVEALRGLGCGVMLGDFGGTDNPRNIAWASWFDFARLSSRRLDHIATKDERRAALEKLVRTASARGARLIAGPVGKAGRAALAEWGVSLFE